MFYYSTDKDDLCIYFLHTSKELVDAEKWLREALAKGEADPNFSYLTKWNPETEQVEDIIGKFDQFPEAGGDESKGEVAAPGPSLQPTQANTLDAAATPTDPADFIDDEF